MTEVRRGVRFTVVEQAPARFVIVPEGQAPLPAIFDTRQCAQEIAQRMAAGLRARRERAQRRRPAFPWSIPS